MKEDEVGRFLRLMAHDLQNVLGAIDLNLQVLPTVAPTTPPEMEPFLARASLACGEMADLLLDVQTFARAVSHMDEFGESKPAIESSFDLNSRVRDTIMALQSNAQARQVTIREVGREAVSSSGDATMVARAIHVLIGEAIRGSFPGSTVDVAVGINVVPYVEISTTQDGLFDEGRPTLSRFLATQMLEDSQARIGFTPTGVRISLKPA